MNDADFCVRYSFYVANNFSDGFAAYRDSMRPLVSECLPFLQRSGVVPKSDICTVGKDSRDGGIQGSAHVAIVSPVAEGMKNVGLEFADRAHHVGKLLRSVKGYLIDRYTGIQQIVAEGSPVT
jgi:hypothetical protein